MRKGMTYLLLILGAVLFSTPFLWTVSTALKSSEEYAKNPSRLIPEHLDFSNFVKAWTALPFPTFVWNTIFVTVVSTVAQAVVGSLVAVALSALGVAIIDQLLFVAALCLVSAWLGRKLFLAELRAARAAAA